jgi:hypothetical protein
MYCSFAKYILKRKAVAESMAETKKSIAKYFSLSFVGVSPKTDKFPFSKSQINNQEMAISPINCNISIF